MRKVRPVVETGWENTVLIRLLHEDGGVGIPEIPANKRGLHQVPGTVPAFGFTAREDTGGGGGIRPEELMTTAILSDWEVMRQNRVKDWKLDPQVLIQQFGEVRDKWIAQDKDGWLSINQPYEGVPDVMEAMLTAGAEVFIITTKQRRFCEALLEDYGLELPPERIFALEDGPKTDVLRELLQRPALAGRSFHFVEDKLETLRRVASDDSFSAIQLHLADWGYNTLRDRKIVGAGIIDKISLLSLEGLLKLGVEEPWLE